MTGSLPASKGSGNPHADPVQAGVFSSGYGEALMVAAIKNVPSIRRLVHFCLCLALLPAAIAARGLGQATQGQSSQGQAAQGQSGQGQQQNQPPAGTQPAQDIPDAPSAVQPPAPKTAFPGAQPAERPTDNSAQPTQDQAQAGQSSSTDSQQRQANQNQQQPPPPKMPPVQTVQPGSAPRNEIPGGYKITTSVNFVLIPVMVKDDDGRRVEGLVPQDFTVKENGVEQKLTFFTRDAYPLAVAVVIDLGMPDVDVQRVNETYTSLVGAFSPYDEVALYTYSSTVTQVADFTAHGERLTAVLDQLKLARGGGNGGPWLGGPLANGPMVNGLPVGTAPTPPVNTPPRESHVLNDAILRAALDLSKRDNRFRKVIFVVSDGRELGSQASYKEVLKLLMTRNIQVKAVLLGSSALPAFKQVERIHHLFLQGYSDILPKYTYATGGGRPYAELTRNAIEDAYQDVTSDARNQYTLGYIPRAVSGSSPYRSIEVIVHRPRLKVTAKDGYYPVLSGH